MKRKTINPIAVNMNAVVSMNSLVQSAVISVGLSPLGVNPYEQMRSSPVGRESNPSYNSCQHNSRISNIHVALTVIALRLTLLLTQ